MSGDERERDRIQLLLQSVSEGKDIGKGPLGALRDLNLIEQGTEHPPRLTDQGWQYLRHGPVAPESPAAGPKR